MLITRQEKERLVVKLAEEGRTTRDIAKEVHISFKNIGKIIRKATGDSSQGEEDEEKEKEILQKSLTPYAQAFKMFRENKSLTEVVIDLDLDAFTVLKYYEDYLTLVRMKVLVDIYPEILQDYNWKIFFHLFTRIKEEGRDKQDITELLQNRNKLKDLSEELEFYHNRISELRSRKSILEQEINSLRRRRDNYDGINPP
jgi:septal ring factor EnvC (AmiA/AmiB activator)